MPGDIVRCGQRTGQVRSRGRVRWRGGMRQGRKSPKPVEPEDNPTSIPARADQNKMRDDELGPTRKVADSTEIVRPSVKPNNRDRSEEGRNRRTNYNTLWELVNERDAPHLSLRFRRLQNNISPRKWCVTASCRWSKRMRMPKQVSGVERWTNRAKRTKWI